MPVVSVNVVVVCLLQYLIPTEWSSYNSKITSAQRSLALGESSYSRAKAATLSYTRMDGSLFSTA